MKKTITVILVLAMVVSMSACGEENSEKRAAEPSMDYHKLLDGDDSVYYYEADVLEESPQEEDDEPMESVMAEGRDGKDRHVIATGAEKLEERQLELKDGYYIIDDARKEYTKEEKEDEENLDLKHKGSSEMKVKGKTYRYDEYQGEYEMEGFDEAGEETDPEIYLYSKRYLYDDKGELYALIYLNELKGQNGEKNLLVYRKTETITKFEASKAPGEIFEIPGNYRQAADEDYGEDEMLEEE